MAKSNAASTHTMSIVWEVALVVWYCLEETSNDAFYASLRIELTTSEMICVFPGGLGALNLSLRKSIITLRRLLPVCECPLPSTMVIHPLSTSQTTSYGPGDSTYTPESLHLGVLLLNLEKYTLSTVELFPSVGDTTELKHYAVMRVYAHLMQCIMIDQRSRTFYN